MNGGQATATAHGAADGSVDRSFPISAADFADLCLEHGVEIAPALRSNRFYHVAARWQEDAIAEEGLRPGFETDERNFPELPLDEEGVYLWPCVGAAQAYADLDTQKLGKGEHLLLEVAGLDYNLLAPDHEEFARLLEEPECFPDGEAIAKLLADSGVVAPKHERREAEYAESIELIRALPTELRLLAANALAASGDAVMLRGSIPPEQIAVCTLNDWELLSDQFSEVHPELDPWKDGEFDDELEAARDEAFDEWVADKEMIDRAELSERLMDPSETAANEEIRYYSRRPIIEGGVLVDTADLEDLEEDPELANGFEIADWERPILCDPDVPASFDPGDNDPEPSSRGFDD